jgi:peptide/nickel transport system permease protein
VIGYIIRRLAWMVFVIFGVMTLTFFIARVIPADPVAAVLPSNAPVEAIEKERERMGLNKPIWVQYGRYINGILHGDFGVSIRTRQPVLRDLIRYFPATVELALAALVMGTAIGLSLGILSAVKQGKIPDHAGRIFAIWGLSMPAFFTGLMLVILFSHILGWLPQLGQMPSYLRRPPHVTGFLILDTMIAGKWALVWTEIKHLILPAFTLGWLSTASIVRITRSSMLEVLPEEYIKTARMKGLRESKVVLKHALKNAMLPTITVIGLRVASLLEGAVLTETVFSWPGLGRYGVSSFLAIDFPAVVGVTIFVAFFYSFCNLLVDLLYGYLNPRIRYT